MGSAATSGSTRSALHIGRVGGLAIALGIGAAVLTGQATASAETGDTSTSTSAAAAGPDSSSPSAGPRVRRGGADDKRTAGERATRRAEARAQRAEERAAQRTDRVEQRRQRTVRVTSPAPDEPATSPAADDPTAPRDRSAGLLDVVATGLAGAGTRPTAQVTAAVVPDRTVVATGLNQPTDFQFLPDGRILVAEKGGRIRIVDNGTVARRPLYRVFTPTQGERGLGALAVDPDFETNGYIYVAYTTIGARDRLARLTVRGDRVVFGSQKVLLQSTDPSAFYHHGGALGFGPDGALYWGVGDNKKSDNAQDLGTIHGKIIRINPDGTIPADNPDLGDGALPQIYAYGFRNPFRLTFTPNGELLVADVGENSFEEVDNVIAGGDYGWPGAEGDCAGCGSINPVYAYGHDGGGAAITSVLFYTGGRLGAEFQNTLLIADLVKGWIKALDCTADFSSCGNARDFDAQAGQTVLLAQGPDGALYQLDYGSGRIVRIGTPSSTVV